jgi:LmbE family N-acetylglucosaminyl deacetylase
MRVTSVVLTAALVFFGGLTHGESTEADSTPIETWKGKTVLIFTPHPDDDTFGCGGIMKILADNGNNVQIVIYTNDDKGSLDLEMTSERLARIRKAEEEKACEILGIPTKNITWLGYQDGDLEYADPQRLRGEAARQIKIHRPDAVFTIDPGMKSERWHKTDHRMAAFITQDAFIASEWHLYYPQHLLVDKLKPYHVPVAYYYYTEDANVTIDITEVFEAKAKAAAAHVSQFEPSISKYTPKMSEETFAGIRSWAVGLSEEDGKMVEKFRRLEWP